MAQIRRGMTMKKIGLLAAAVVAACAGSALAQPAEFTDIGDYGESTGPVAANVTLVNPGDIMWARITLTNDFLGSSNRTVIFDTEGTAVIDTELGLFDNTGTLIANDDDGGTGLLSRLSFGTNGGNGGIPAGVYYIATGDFNINYADGFSAISTGLDTGTININVSVTLPPPGLWSEASGTPAGELPETAQIPSGSGSLGGIQGVLETGTVDMFKIRVCDPTLFSATTVGQTTLDTQLFLFNADGLGVAVNDDEVAGLSLQSTITNQFVQQEGEYYITVAQYNRDPVDINGALIWQNTPFGSERAPDGPGAANPVASWINTTGTGGYVIALTGACYPGPVIPDCIADTDDGSGTGTQDGAVTIDDLLYYIVRFQAGC